MKFTTKQLFNLTDGRMSTNMDDVYLILNEATGNKLFTHQLPKAMEYVEKQNPQWFQDAKTQLAEIKSKVGNNFIVLMEYIDKNYADFTFEVTKC